MILGVKFNVKSGLDSGSFGLPKFLKCKGNPHLFFSLDHVTA